ncbi:MAG: M20 family metallopeptidase [Promethearchaeota archaeon]
MNLDDTLRERLVYILQRLVQIPTENPPGKTEEIVDFLISTVFKEEEGFQNQVISHFKNNIKLHNLITKIGFGKKKILLSGHFDVVPVGDSSKWDIPPFSARIIDGKLHGRGSADMKGGIVSLIGVMKSLSKNKEFLENHQLIFLGTADEEAGMSGSLTLASTGIINDAELLIVGEPTNLEIGIAEKGILWVKLKIYGRSAHGSMPEEGLNAIEGAINIIPQLQTCLNDTINPFLGSSTINIGKIHGGTKINVVPDYTELEVDFRLIPEHDTETIVTNLKRLNLNPWKMDIEIVNILPPLQSDSKHPFIQNLAEISNSRIIGLPYATDASRFVTEENSIPFIIFGPGNPKDVHKLNESISIDQVYSATEYLTRALLKTYYT